MEYTFTTNGRVVSNMFASYTNTFVALCELINNSLQAKSKVINITISESADKKALFLKKIDSIEIKDNGWGVSQSDFKKKIFEIGTDAKDDGQGIGRFAAFQIGEALTIETVAEDNALKTYTKTLLTLNASMLQGEAIEKKKVKTTHTPLEGTPETYYRVKISNIYSDDDTKKEKRKKTHKSLYSDNIAEAIFLQYPLDILQDKVAFTINSKPVDKNDYIIGEACERDELFTDSDGVEHPTKLTFIRYKSASSGVKVFLRVDNSDIKTVAHSFDYKCELPEADSWLVYVDADLFNNNKDIFRNLQITDVDPNAKHLVHSIKGFIDGYFHETFKEYFDFSKKLRTDTYYPYRQHNASSGSKAVVFNQLAYFIEEEHRILFSKSDIRKVIYPLIDKAISHGELIAIIEQVLNLNVDAIKKFKTLIERTKLEEVIFFTDEIARKSQFLDFLHKIVYGEPAKRVKERSVLHKIVEKQLWIFGEHYTNAPTLFSDKNLENNLTKLREKWFGYELSADDDNIDEVEDEKNRDITDLFFFNERIGDNGKHEVMIVELKRPSCLINQKELNQVDKYMFDIQKVGCFPTDVTFKIYLISSNISEFAKTKIGIVDDSRPTLFTHSKDGKIEIHVMKWADILSNNRQKLSYLGNVLNTEDVDATEMVKKEYPALDMTGIFSSITSG
ncbi:MAG: hypothetical protein CXR30_00395 [Geobacter sp.]|nr:MAG: hypothetical protein CXR30_00395 [Geobacter sp.]